MDGLNEKQKQFCEEYMVDFNATRSAARAGYSPRSAAKQGSRLMNSPAVREYLGSLLEERRQDTRARQYQILRELSGIGFAKVDAQVIKPSEKLKALELLMKHFGMFERAGAAEEAHAGVVILPEATGGDGDG